MRTDIFALVCGNYMLLKVSFLALTAVAAISISQKKENPSIKHSSEKDDPSLQQIEKKEEKYAENVSEKEEALIENEVELEISDYGSTQFLIEDKKLKLEKEFLQRKVILERKWIELHSLKEQRSYIALLRKSLEAKKVEIDTLNVGIHSLQAERNDLFKEIKEGMWAEKQVEIAKEAIKKMQKKIEANEMHVKGHLMRLQEQVSVFRSNGDEDSAVEERKKVVNDVELECIEMRRENKELELEKRELVVKLVAAQARITSLTESEIIAEIEKASRSFKRANEDLSKQVERLQKNRFDMVEELIYQRWLNACLRFEIQNHSSVSRNQRPCDHKFKQLLLDDNNSSHTSLTESEKNDSSSTTESSSSSQRSSISKKSSLIHKIKKWGRSRGNPAARNGLIRRFSTSMVPSRTQILTIEHNYSGNDTPFSEQRLTKSIETRRRVSFTDSTATLFSTCQQVQESMEGHLHNMETNMITSPISGAEMNRGKQNISVAEISVAKSGSSIGQIEQQSIKKDNEDAKLENASKEKQHSRVPDMLTNENKVEFKIVIFIFCFVSLVFYFLLLLLLNFTKN